MSVEQFLRYAEASGQSEAKAIADCVRDAIESEIEVGESKNIAGLVAGMAEEFIDWSNALRKAVTND